MKSKYTLLQEKSVRKINKIHAMLECDKLSHERNFTGTSPANTGIRQANPVFGKDMITPFEKCIGAPSSHSTITQKVSIIVGSSSRLSVNSDVAGFHDFLQFY